MALHPNFPDSRVRLVLTGVIIIAVITVAGNRGVRG